MSRITQDYQLQHHSVLIRNYGILMNCTVLDRRQSIDFPNICLITGPILHFHTAQCVTFYDFNTA